LTARLAAEAELGKLRATLEANLERRQHQIEAVTCEVNAAGAEADVARAKAAVAAATAAEAEARARHTKLADKLTAAFSSMRECYANLERLQAEQDDAKADLVECHPLSQLGGWQWRTCVRWSR
jgi:chromosome segregation ATPase